MYGEPKLARSRTSRYDRGALNFEGIWARPVQSKAVRKEPSTAISMETSLRHDFFLASVSVIPAATVWVATNRLYFGVALGASIFLAAEYGYPALRRGHVDFAFAIRFLAAIRESIRSRAARGV